MEISAEQLEIITLEVKSRGITLEDLSESLIDHICCSIENDTSGDFSAALSKAIAGFGDGGLEEIQRKTNFLLTLKRDAIMKSTMFILGYISALLTSSGFIFKLMHWPGANMMLILGIALLNFGFLPMYFYHKYKQSTSLKNS